MAQVTTPLSEFKLIPIISPAETEKTLNRLGAEGWVFLGIIPAVGCCDELPCVLMQKVVGVKVSSVNDGLAVPVGIVPGGFGPKREDS